MCLFLALLELIFEKHCRKNHMDLWKCSRNKIETKRNFIRANLIKKVYLEIYQRCMFFFHSRAKSVIFDGKNCISIIFAPEKVVTPDKLIRVCSFDNPASLSDWAESAFQQHHEKVLSAAVLHDGWIIWYFNIFFNIFPVILGEGQYTMCHLGTNSLPTVGLEPVTPWIKGLSCKHTHSFHTIWAICTYIPMSGSYWMPVAILTLAESKILRHSYVSYPVLAWAINTLQAVASLCKVHVFDPMLQKESTSFAKGWIMRNLTGETFLWFSDT